MGIIIDGTTGIDAGHLPIQNSTNVEVEGTLSVAGVTTLNGNVGVGVAPSAWSGGIKALDINSRTSLFELNGDTVLNNNTYHNGTSWIRKTSNSSSMYEQINGGHYWSTSPSGIAGSATTFTNAMLLDASGNLSVGGTSNSYNNTTTLTINNNVNASRVDFNINGTLKSFISCDSSGSMYLNSVGNILSTSSTGALGYGTGSGGTVTQLTSKSTSVTLNKPTGQITMNNASLAAGASVIFAVNNTLITDKDTIIVNINNGANGDKYDLFVWYITSSVCYLRLKNIHGASLSDALVINFTLIKGANS